MVLVGGRNAYEAREAGAVVHRGIRDRGDACGGVVSGAAAAETGVGGSAGDDGQDDRPVCDGISSGFEVLCGKIKGIGSDKEGNRLHRQFGERNTAKCCDLGAACFAGCELHTGID